MTHIPIAQAAHLVTWPTTFDRDLLVRFLSLPILFIEAALMCLDASTSGNRQTPTGYDLQSSALA